MIRLNYYMKRIGENRAAKNVSTATDKSLSTGSFEMSLEGRSHKIPDRAECAQIAGVGMRNDVF